MPISNENIDCMGEADIARLIMAYNAVEADRDRYKARCEALERALNYPSCSNPECHWYTPCDTCKADSDFCDHLCDDDGEAAFDMSESCPFWIFDESRFAQDSNHT